MQTVISLLASLFVPTLPAIAIALLCTFFIFLIAFLYRDKAIQNFASTLFLIEAFYFMATLTAYLNRNI